MPHTPRYAAPTLPLRRLGLVTGLIAAVLTLTGCFAVEMKATVNSDDTVSGTARIGIAKSLSSLAGGSSGLLSELKSGEDPCTFGTKKAAEKDYDDGNFVGVECTFDRIPLADFNQDSEDNNGVKIVREGDKYHLSGRFDETSLASDTGTSSGSGSASANTSASSTPSAALPSGIPTDLSSLLPSGFPSNLSSLLPSGLPSNLSSLLPSGFPTDLSSLLPSGFPSNLSSLLPSGFPTDLASLIPTTGATAGGAVPSDLPGLDPSAILKTAKISFQFTFPGKVESSKGQVKGNTVTFTPDSQGKIDFETIAGATGSGSSTSAASNGKWIGLGAVVVILAAVATWLVLHRRRAAAVAGAAPAGFGGPGAGFGGPTAGTNPPPPAATGYDWGPPPQQYPPPQEYQPPPSYQPPPPTQPYQPPPPTQPPPDSPA